MLDLFQYPIITVSYSDRVPFKDRPKVHRSCDLYEIIKPLYPEGVVDYCEIMYAVLVGRANRVLGVLKISEGGYTSTSLDVRKLFGPVLLAKATSIVLVHNHPSGNMTPSGNDLDVTRKVKEVGKLMDIQLLDHLIITREGYLSFADEGLL